MSLRRIGRNRIDQANVIVLLDGQWGSTGKGKLSGRLGREVEFDLVCSSFGPNAGHTYVDSESGVERKVIFKHIPTAAVTSKCPVCILPDSVIDVERLMSEVEQVGQPVFVHPRTAVVTKDDANAAAITGRHLAGTMRGTGHAIARKILRIEGTKLAKDVLPSSMIEDTTDLIHSCARSGGRVLVEMSQGFDLSVNHGFDYPYLTSRDITIGTAMNAAGLTLKDNIAVVGSLRVFPIRVGNVEGGWSGPHHSDQMEVTWSMVTGSSHSPDPIEERTTVTNRVRRVFTFSYRQMMRFVEQCAPDALFLNFIQYLDASMKGVQTVDGLIPAATSMISSIERASGVPILWVGTGADDKDMVQMI